MVATFTPARPHSATVVDHGLGRHHEIGVVGRLGQRRHRLPGALAQHRLAPRIDRIDRAAKAGLAQVIAAAGRWSSRHRPTARRSRPSGATAARGAGRRDRSAWSSGISARRNGGAKPRRPFCENFRGLPKPCDRPARSSSRGAHDNVRIGRIPIWRAVAILPSRPLGGPDIPRGRHMLKSFGVAACRDRAGRSRRGCVREPCARRRRHGRCFRKASTRACSTRPSTGPTTSSTASSTPARRRSTRPRRASRCRTAP